MKLKVKQKLDNEVVSNSAGKPVVGLGVRHMQVFLWVTGMLLSYANRVNMSIAIVAMTDTNQENYFPWSLKIQSVILSSFSWGYMCLMVVGGALATRFGGYSLMTLTVGVHCAIGLLIPVCATYGGWQLVCACRVVQGLFQGFLYPTTHNLMGKWVPLDEKARLGTIVFTGIHMGTVCQYMTSGFLAAAWGWPAMFYVWGVLGLLWTVCYMVLGASSPQTSRYISEEERMHIQTSLGQVGPQKRLRTPWTAIWKSPGFLAVLVAHCGYGWGHWTLLTEMPTYMKYVLGFDIKSNGMLSALPYIALVITSFPLGWMSDYLINKNYLSVTTTRKLCNSIGFFGPAAAILGVAYAPAGNQAVAVVLLVVVLGLCAGHVTGFILVHIDMSPNFAGSMMGLTNFFCSFLAIFPPLVVGFIIEDETDANEWKKLFFLTSATYVVSNLVFLAFGTSERQAWNDPSSDQDVPQKEKIEKKV